MTYKSVILPVFLILFFSPRLWANNQDQADSDQQIGDFSLAGFGERGKKSWDLAGKSADVFTDVVKLKDITGNLYGDSEQIKLTADKGDFHKNEGRVHLEDNVVVTTSSGSKLTTESLDWDRKKQLVSTKDPVNIERENMISTALGISAEPNLNTVTLEKDVTVEISPPLLEPSAKEQLNEPVNSNKTIITCDGPMSINYENNVATFNNNVKVDRGDAQIYSDVMDVYFNADKSDDAVAKEAEPAQEESPLGMGASKIDRIVARGHVKIVRGENESYSDEAIYNALDKKITLLGKPRLVLYSAEDTSASPGN